MHVTNVALVEALGEAARLMELAGENPFKARAFLNAARALEGLEHPAADLLASGELARLKGFGKGILGAIGEFIERGEILAVEEIRAAIPAVAFEMVRLPDLGPAKVRTLLANLELTSLADLEAACLDNRLLEVKGFGDRTQQRILEGIRFARASEGRHRIDAGLLPARVLVTALEGLAPIAAATITGSVRRRCDTIGDVDLLVVSDDPAAAVEAVAACLADHGATIESTELDRVTGRLEGGVAVDVLIATPASFAARLVLTTGCRRHVEALRERAAARGLALEREGLRRGDEPLATADEAAIYAALELAWIPPELREDRGEIEAAAAGALPDLVTVDDLSGCFHVHSTWSDGRNSLAQIANHARKLGLAWVGMADHSRAAAYARGLSIERLRAQGAEIDKLNADGEGARLLKGVESDILADGSLDYPDEVLAELDFVVGSVHSGLNMERETATARIVKALEHPRLTILGHPTGRLLLGREGYELDWERVFATAAANGKVIEINAHPARLDLDWRLVRQALAAGVKLAVSPDAHDLAGFAHLEHGVAVARKGWATAADVVNTTPRAGR